MPSTTINVDELEKERRREVARVLEDHLRNTPIGVEQLAHKAGCANSAIYNLLGRNKEFPSKAIGSRLAKKLIAAGVDHDALMTAAGFTVSADKKDATVLRISNKISRLPPDRREVVEGVVDGLLEAIRKKK